MKRRAFVKRSSLSVASTVLLPSFILDACRTVNVPLSLEEVSAYELQELMSTGKLTSKTATKFYLDRINTIDRSGPKLNSIIELNPDAIAIAEKMDEERKAGKVRGPLHGIPVLIKDNINTADKTMTTAGSLALKGHYAKEDAFIIQRMRKAGAVLLGKTNLSEWANFRSTRSSSGWSSRGGQTKNPYVLDRNPCGSSSGSGVAVSANLCALAIGTETNGSIACPSSINGVVGIKPTVGVWSRTGIIPISHTQDTAGPMTRTVRDAAIMLGALTGVDQSDEASVRSEGKVVSDYTRFLLSDGLKGKRIGIEKSFLKVHEAVDLLFAEAIQHIKEAGAEIVEVNFLERARGISRDEFNVLQYEFKHGLNEYLKRYDAPMKSLEEIIAFNKREESMAMPFFKQEILESSQEKGDLTESDYQESLKKILSASQNAIDETLNEFSLDAICGPTNGPSWCTDLVNGDSFSGYGMYSNAAIAGYPSIQVPMGLVSGLPVGLTFLSTAYREGDLISIAYAYEQISKKRVAPQFLPSLTFVQKQ